MVGLNLWKQVQSLQCRIPYEGTCFAGYKRISLASERERVGWIYIYASRPHSLHISRRSRVCVCVLPRPGRLERVSQLGSGVCGAVSPLGYLLDVFQVFQA